MVVIRVDKNRINGLLSASCTITIRNRHTIIQKVVEGRVPWKRLMKLKYWFEVESM